MSDAAQDPTKAPSGGEVVEVHEFELAYAHLHVPQMV